MTRTRTAAAALAALAGCDASPHATPPTAPSTAPARPLAVSEKPEPAPTAIPHPAAPKPDTTRLRYDPATRTLEVGDPPVPGGRWMLTSPKEPRGVPVERAYQFPPTVDLDRVAVFYTAANGRASQAVSLREIVDARDVR